MINMNSPTVQTIIQSNGYNPFTNNQYIPQPQQYYQQPTYQGYNTYNPYISNQIVKQQSNDLDNWVYSYDPMPNVIVNENRGIRSVVQQAGTMTYNGYNQFNNYAFNGYMNPILMRNQEEQRRIAEREEAIAQGKIWRSLLKNVKAENEDFDIDEAVKRIESLYYQEPEVQELTMKEKMIIDKNKHIAEVESRLDYYRNNNIPVMTPHMIAKSNFYGYYNHINSVIGNQNCDMFDYFTRVYPELKFEQLSAEVDKFNKNLKNRYNSTDFDKAINKVSADRPDSYYQKLMESFAENGVRMETSNGLVITADQMEVKLPESLLRKRKNKQDLYYEQRKKFYDAVFKKES